MILFDMLLFYFNILLFKTCHDAKNQHITISHYIRMYVRETGEFEVQ